jgi:hypothetical protein
MIYEFTRISLWPSAWKAIIRIGSSRENSFMSVCDDFLF